MNHKLTYDDAVVIIRESLNVTLHSFRKYPHIFLTEEDVRCYLYFQMFIRLENLLERSSDGFLTSAIHSEVRWYGKDGDKNKRSDIVVLDVEDLRISDNIDFRLPSKGYGFNNFFGVIEIKLRRGNSRKKDVNWLSEIQKDIDTLSFLQTGVINSYNPLMISLNLDKHANIEEKLATLKIHSGVEVIYIGKEA